MNNMNEPNESQPEPGGTVPPVGTPPSLDRMRRQLDELDARLVELLTQRARIVVDVGAYKRLHGLPIYAPHREQEVIRRVLELNDGPLPARTLEAIFRELMSGSFALERPQRVGYLGPAGSFSHLAAVRHFGSSVELSDLHAIDAVFSEVAASRINYGLVPYENSIGGVISDTLDAFLESDVHIYAEALIGVEQILMANCAPEEIRRIYSKPQVFEQCRRWLAARLPQVELIPVASTAVAARRAVDEPAAAAIGSQLAAELYSLNIVFEGIQDKSQNVTRFLIIGREYAEPSGDDKTSIMFTTVHRPGALVDVLGIFRDAAINLSHIDKRPSGRRNWEYTFFIDADTHQRDPAMQQAIELARGHCVALKVLGSYPRARRILQ